MGKYSYDYWQTIKGRKEIIRLTKLNKSKKHKNKNINIKNSNLDNNIEQKSYIQKLNVPSNFSFINNTEETIYFFNDLMQKLEKQEERTAFYLNLKNVESVTVDAIMYLLAIIRNTKVNEKTNNKFCGNIPDDILANQEFVKSGFFNYVKTKNIDFVPSGSRICIKTSDHNNPDLALQIVEFAKEKVQMSDEQERALYQTLIELMSNTYHHAYSSKDNVTMEHVWYIYVENVEDKICFTFLDTGVGIAKTIYLKYYEKFQKIFLNTKETDYVMSAFTGTFRSQTKELYRSTGLPEIYTYCQKGLFSKFTLVTNNSICRLCKNNNILLNNEFNGTLYFWEISEKEI